MHREKPQTNALERDIIVILHRHRCRRGLLTLRLLVTATLATAAAISALLTITATLLAVATAALLITATLLAIAAPLLSTGRTEQLHIFSDNTDAAAALPGLLILPSILLQAAFDKHGTPLGQILGSNLRRTSPACHIEESCFLAPLALTGTGAHAVDREAKLRQRGTTGSRAHLGISRQVTDNHHLV